MNIITYLNRISVIVVLWRKKFKKKCREAVKKVGEYLTVLYDKIGLRLVEVV